MEENIAAEDEDKMKRRTGIKWHRVLMLAALLMMLLFGVIYAIEGRFGKEKGPAEEQVENPREEPKEEPKEEPVTEQPGETQNPGEPSETQNPGTPSNEIPSGQDSVTVENPDTIDVLVNRKNSLPETYAPDDLVKLTDVPTVLSNPEVNQLRKAAYEALKELFEAAKDEKEYTLYARSGYRSYGTQVSLYGSYVNNHGQAAADKFSAKPGQSEHQTGLSMDITCEAMNFQLDTTFGKTEEGKWVAENAHRFGFIVRYPEGKETITGYMYEPWHIRYMGKELATKVYESGLTYEEYLEQ